MELSPHVMEKLKPGHKLNTVIEASLIEDLITTTRIIALIEATDPGGGENLQALLIYLTARVPVHSPIDLKLESVIPLDFNVKCEIGKSKRDTENEILICLTSGNVNLLFQMPFSHQTNSFVSKVMRAVEVFEEKRDNASTGDFGWLKSYFEAAREESKETTKSMASKTNLIDFDPIPEEGASTTASGLSSSTTEVSKSRGSDYVVYHSSDDFQEATPNMGMNRQSIAMGMCPPPIAARETHIKHQMSLKEDLYTTKEPFTIFIGTWNVNGQSPSVGLADWLACDEKPPDLYAVGFQELDLNKEAFLFNVTAKEQEWLDAVLASVHPKEQYIKVRLVRLVGMMLIVLVKSKHKNHIKNVAMETVGTGIMNKWGNKGAVSIRLDLYDTSICFVNAHMAAHVEEFERRNEDHDCVFQRTSFTLSVDGTIRSINDHDHIYFLGDMNYRVNAGDYDVKELASKGQFKLLLENDQLNLQRKIKRVFREFKEGDITFKPTYKYNLGSDTWDSSEKARQPAWCDRILWKGEDISQLVYRSHPSLKISDHKPVSAVFNAQIKVINECEYRKIHEELIKEWDKLENEFLPQVTVNTNEIFFDPVKFLQTQTKSLTVANTGQVPVTFQFLEKCNTTSICKPWLTIRPFRASIRPGDTCYVNLEVEVNKQSAHGLNTGKEQIYDILILHLEGGKDIFITVTGEYERSCFGASINALVHINKPFKDVTLPELIDLESENPKNQLDLPYAGPKELWYLIDHLYTHGLHTKELFTTPGRKKDIMEIRESLDAGVPGEVLPGEVHSVAEALLIFLASLAEPVIPYYLYEEALSVTANFSLCKGIIERLSDHHRNVFSYLICFLKELLKHSPENQLEAKTLAHIFGTVLLRCKPSSATSVKSLIEATERKKMTFIYFFLVNDDE